MAKRPFEGLKVIEYGEVISAPYCGRLLAGLGAEVIKVENPVNGDKARANGPFPGGGTGRTLSTMLSCGPSA